MLGPVEVLKHAGELLLGIAGIALLVLIAKGIMRRMTRRSGKPSAEPSTDMIPAGITLCKRSILTHAESAFYKRLKLTVGNRYDIYAQVPLWSVVEARGEWNAASAFTNRLSLKRLDFVLVEPASFETEKVIELDDSTHREEARIKRDRFIDTVLAKAGIPIVRIRASSCYRDEDLRKAVL
jgi:hypothetical protein